MKYNKSPNSRPLNIAPLSLVVLAGSAGSAMASGFSLNLQSAEALGAATAGAQATPATPGNAFFNPASIVGVEGLETSLSFIGVLNDTSYENADAALFGVVPVAGETEGEGVIGDAIIPTGAAAFKLSDHLFAGVAVYAPFGFDTEYEDTSVLRYHGTYSKVLSGVIQPMVGFSFGDWSIAAGPKFQYVDISLEGAIDAAGIESALLMTAAVPGTDDAFVDVSANDWGTGFVVGVQGAIGDRLTVGASFSSKIEHNLEGTAAFDISASTSGQTLAGLVGLFQDTGVTSEFTTPGNIQFGLRFEANDKTRVLASGRQTRWESFDQLVLNFENPVQADEVTTQNWQNAWAGSVGVERDFGPAQTVRLGVMYEEDPANPDFSSPRVPGASRVWLAAGYSRDLSDRAELHLAASYAIAETTPLNESAAYPENLFRGSATGDVDIAGFVAGVGIDWRF
ncbi:OmpP1/FadL family transporter [Hyphococcus sp.]|jgi:long-chain fatty acid transport protein|uniref:OmpP1/FadL family transporter n=1 Tax=Hyphococcus sp. TaxID=2038636 RepID=UPI003D1451D6